jgi:putative tryptophan/tyrosine transport system substrate-binding protein
VSARRRLLLGGGAALALHGLPGGAQSGAPRRIAFLSGGSEGDAARFLPAFLEGLRERGYSEGHNIGIDRRFANYSAERATALAAEIAALKPALIVANGGGIAPACRLAPALPVVFLHSGNPVDAGFADTYARPGRNASGMTMMALDLIPKRVDLLRQIQPRLKRLAFLASPEHAGQQRELEASRAAAAQFNIEVVYYEARTPAQLNAVLPRVVADKPDGALLFSDALMIGQRKPLAEFFLQHGIPSAAGWVGFPESGHLMSYGPERLAVWKRLAYFVDRILRGARPADLPIELPSVMELAVNRRTAATMQLEIPTSILLRAERVIDTAT